ncbi:MAG: hypothetical protein C4293_10075, partial [Nitrospiraceae bacterium]
DHKIRPLSKELDGSWLPQALIFTENGRLIHAKTIRGDRTHTASTRDEADAQALCLAKAWIDSR